jgi:SAM-dependent methyltransferase
VTGAEAEKVAAGVARVVPEALAPILDARFTRSHLLFDEYVFRLALGVVAEMKLGDVLDDWATADDVVSRAGLHPQRALVPIDWLLRHLAARGILASDERGRVRAVAVLPAPDPLAVLAEQRSHDAACLPSYELAATVARDYPAFLRGERPGEDILFAPKRLPLWVAYFSNDNGLYAVNNRVGAVALDAWLPGGESTILELGGGLGSGAAAVLERLAASGRLAELRAYRFTELVPAFLRRGERVLQEQWPNAAFLSAGPLDMNRPFADQGVAPGSVSAVYAVNTLHVAHDLAFTLGEVHRALAPGGRVIFSECIRPRAGDTPYPEFVFNLLETFRAPRLHPRYRPNGGFLTPEQWEDAVTAAGFDDVKVMPDIRRVRDVVATFYVACFGATRPA